MCAVVCRSCASFARREAHFIDSLSVRPKCQLGGMPSARMCRWWARRRLTPKCPSGARPASRSSENSELRRSIGLASRSAGLTRVRSRCSVSDRTLLGVCQKACLPFRPVAPCRTPSRQQQHVLEASSHRPKRCSWHSGKTARRYQWLPTDSFPAPVVSIHPASANTEVHHRTCFLSAVTHYRDAGHSRKPTPAVDSRWCNAKTKIGPGSRSCASRCRINLG
jgi:hypothetical protein